MAMSSDRQATIAFSEYLITKIHFGVTDFNLRLFSRKRYSFEALNKRSDKLFFYKFASYFTQDTVRQEYLISCFLRDRNAWIGELLDYEILDYHEKRMMVINSLDHYVSNDLIKIEDYLVIKNLSLKQFLTCTDKSPILIKCCKHVGIKFETVALFDYFYNFTRFDNDDILWKEQKLQIIQYLKLLEITPSIKQMFSQFNQSQSIAI